MKKTLIITLEYPPTIGGIATYVDELAAALDPAQVVVLAPTHPEQNAWDEQVAYTVERRTLLWPKYIWPRWTRLLWHVWRISRKHEIEIMLIHHVLPAGYAGVFAQKILKIPFLLFSHGTDLVAGTASAWKRRMVTWVSLYAEQLIFNSESLKRRFLRVLPQFEQTSSVLYPCPSTDFLVSPKDEEIDALKNQYALQGKQVILSVSRITDGKGFPHLIRMMPEILKQAPHAVWLIVGDGPKKQAILQSVREQHLQNVVRFIGEVPHEELKKYYYLADVFALLTHPDEGREEGLGLVFLEAAATGLPVVAGKSGGVEEAVVHTQTGLVVDVYHGDGEVVDAITTLLNDQSYAQELGKRAQDRIKSNFVWEHQLKKIAPWIEQKDTRDKHQEVGRTGQGGNLLSSDE